MNNGSKLRLAAILAALIGTGSFTISEASVHPEIKRVSLTSDIKSPDNTKTIVYDDYGIRKLSLDDDGVITENTDIDGPVEKDSIDNQSNLNVKSTGSLTVSGEFNNETNGTVKNEGRIDGKDLKNDGTFNNAVEEDGQGTAAFSGTLTNGSEGGTSASLTNKGTFTVTGDGSNSNKGKITNEGGSFTVNGQMTNSGNIDNKNASGGTKGEMNLFGGLTNSGTVTNETGGSLTVQSGLQNTKDGTFTNNGTVNATGLTTNDGTLDNQSGKMDLLGGLKNSGSVTTQESSLLNLGSNTLENAKKEDEPDSTASIQNAGGITTGALNNSGTYNNNGTTTVTGKATNNESGTLTNGSSGKFTAGSVENKGDITNSSTQENGFTVNGELNNAESGTFTNDTSANLKAGSITNSSSGKDEKKGFSNKGNVSANSFNNTGSAENTSGAKMELSGSFTNGDESSDSATFDNSGTITAEGDVTNNSTFNNKESSGSLTGNNVTNKGTMSNEKGQVHSKKDLTNNGSFTNGESGTVTVDGNLKNEKSGDNNATFTNKNTVTVNGEDGVTNSGKFTNGDDSSGTSTHLTVQNGGFDNETGGEVENNGQMDVLGDEKGITNNGTLNNKSSGTITTGDGNNTNNGSFTNEGGFNGASSAFENQSKGTLTNKGTFNAGAMTNDGSVTNDTGSNKLDVNSFDNKENGKLTNQNGSNMTVFGELKNSANTEKKGVENSGTLKAGKVTNSGKFANKSGANLTVEQTGGGGDSTLTNEDGGTITNEKDATITAKGKITNKSTGDGTKKGIENSGKFNAEDGFDNEGGSLANKSDSTFTVGTDDAHKDFTNSGDVQNEGNIIAKGSIYNNGNFENINAQVTAEEDFNNTGKYTVDTDSSLDVEGKFTNSGKTPNAFTNQGTVTVKGSEDSSNSGTIDNDGGSFTVQNGKFSNTGDITNKNSDAGKSGTMNFGKGLETSGTVTNSSTSETGITVTGDLNVDENGVVDNGKGSTFSVEGNVNNNSKGKNGKSGVDNQGKFDITGKLNNGSDSKQGSVKNSNGGQLSVTGEVKNSNGSITNDGSSSKFSAGSLTNGTTTEGSATNGTIDNTNGATFDVNGVLDNQKGTITNSSGSTFNAKGTTNNSGEIKNESGSTYNATGETKNSGTITNSGADSKYNATGKVTNNSDASINNSNGATFTASDETDNSGTITNGEGSTYNAQGKITNNSGKTGDGGISNQGTFNADKGIDNEENGKITNSGNGNFSVGKEGENANLTNKGEIDNQKKWTTHGETENTGTLKNSDSATYQSDDKVTNSGSIDNSGTFNAKKGAENSGKLTNSNEFTVESGGFTNSGKLTNSNEFTVESGGFTNSGKASDDGKGVTNSGTFSVEDGDLTNSGTFSNSGNNASMTLNDALKNETGSEFTNENGADIDVTGDVTNSGTFTSTGEGSTFNAQSNFENSGTLKNESNSSLTVGEKFKNSGKSSDGKGLTNSGKFSAKDVENTGSVTNQGSMTFSGAVSGLATDANITNSGSGNLTVEGDASNYKGTFNQQSGTTNVGAGAKFFGGASTVSGGDLNWSATDGDATVENLTMDGGNLNIEEGGHLNLGGSSSIKDAVNANVKSGSYLSVGSGASVDLGKSDKWNGDVTLNGGTLTLHDDLFDGTKGNNGTLHATSGTLDLQSDFTFSGTGADVEKDVKLKIGKHTTHLKDGANLTIDGDDEWSDGTIEIVDEKSTLNVEGTIPEKNNGSIKAQQGNVNFKEGSKFTVNKKTDIGKDANVDVEKNSDVTIKDGGQLTLDDKDKWHGNVTLDKDGHLYYGKKEEIDGTLTGNDGDLHLLEGSIFTFRGDSSNIKDAVDVDIQKGSQLKITDGATFNMDNEDTWAGLIDVGEGGKLNADNVDNTKYGGGITQESGESVFKNGSNVAITDDRSSITGGKVTLQDNSKLTYGAGLKEEFHADDLLVETGSTFGILNDAVDSASADNLEVSEEANFTVDLNQRGYSGDKFNFDNVKLAEGADEGNLNVSEFNILGDCPVDRYTIYQLFTGTEDMPENLHFTATEELKRTPSGWFGLKPVDGMDGYYNLYLAKYVPEEFRGQAAILGMYSSQLQVDDIVTNHFILHDQNLIDKALNANKYSAASPLFAPYQKTYKDGGLWYKTYASFDRMDLTRPKLDVGNNVFGTLVGADLPAVELNEDWEFIPTGYIGYNWAHQYFDGVSSYQNGGQLGVMGTFIRNQDFITSITAYGGGYTNEMSYGGYDDNLANWFAGSALKTAYNLHPFKDFIVQPNAFISYNAFGRQSWHSDYGNIDMMTKMFNGINAGPGVNFILSKDTWSLYTTFQYLFFINDDVSGTIGHINLPDTKLDHGMVTYGIGATKTFKDTVAAYGQLNLHNAGVTGIGFQFGLQWLFDTKLPKLNKSAEKNKVKKAKNAPVINEPVKEVSNVTEENDINTDLINLNDYELTNKNVSQTQPEVKQISDKKKKIKNTKEKKFFKFFKRKNTSKTPDVSASAPKIAPVVDNVPNVPNVKKKKILRNDGKGWTTVETSDSSVNDTYKYIIRLKAKC